MGSIIVHRIDYNGEGALGGQRHIPNKNLPKTPPPPPSQGGHHSQAFLAETVGTEDCLAMM